MENNYSSLDNKVQESTAFGKAKLPIALLASGAFALSGCTPQGGSSSSYVAPAFVHVYKSDIPEKQFEKLELAEKLKFSDGFEYMSPDEVKSKFGRDTHSNVMKRYEVRAKDDDKKAGAAAVKSGQPAARQGLTRGQKFAIGALVVAGVAAGIYAVVNTETKRHNNDNDDSIFKRGRDPNKGSDQGKGKDTDKDNINW